MLNDKEKLIELMEEARNICRGRNYDDCKLCSGYGNGLPCIDHLIADHLIENDVTVQKKGEWKWEYIVAHGVAEKKAVCSLCGVPNKQYKPPYCPHCGAKMDAPKDGDT